LGVGRHDRPQAMVAYGYEGVRGGELCGTASTSSHWPKPDPSRKGGAADGGAEEACQEAMEDTGIDRSCAKHPGGGRTDVLQNIWRIRVPWHEQRLHVGKCLLERLLID